MQATAAIVLLLLPLTFGPLGPQDAKVLASFEPDEEVEAGSTVASLSTSPERATEGRRALLLDFAGTERVVLRLRPKGAWDFRGFDKLMLDVWREGPPFTVNTKFVDGSGRRYVVWYYLVRPGFNVVEYSLRGMKGAIDLSDIREMTMWTERKVGGRMWVDNLRLTKGEVDDSWLLKRRGPRRPSLVPSGSLIFNGDFELGFWGWGTWGQWDGGSYVFDTGAGEDAVSGETAAAIVCWRRGRGGIWSKPVRLEPGTYRLTMFVKGKGGGVRMFWQFEGKGLSLIHI